MSVKDDFIWALKKGVGLSGKRYQTSFGLTSNSHWSAAFLCCEAKKLGILEIVIPNTMICQNFLTSYTKYPISTVSKSKELEEGDLILLSFNSIDSARSDCVGTIVEYDCDNDVSDVILGDYGSVDPSKSSVGLVTIDMGSKCVKHFIRPAWNEV